MFVFVNGNKSAVCSIFFVDRKTKEPAHGHHYLFGRHLVSTWKACGVSSANLCAGARNCLTTTYRNFVPKFSAQHSRGNQRSHTQYVDILKAFTSY